MDSSAIRIEPFCDRHLTQVCRLERICFDDPWTPESFRQEVRRMESIGVSRVLLEAKRVRAYSIAWFTADEGHLANIAVSPRHRGRGFARALMRDLIHEAAVRIAGSVWLEVRATNTPAIRLYESFLFEPVTIRRNYYTDDQEDALVMVRRMSRDGAETGCGSSASADPSER